MTTFEDRKKAEERRHVLKQELAFKITARANKLAGLWAAERMGHEDPAAYAAEIVAAAFESAGHATEKLSADLSAAGVAVSDAEFAAKIEALKLEAEEQVIEEASA